MFSRESPAFKLCWVQNDKGSSPFNQKCIYENGFDSFHFISVQTRMKFRGISKEVESVQVGRHNSNVPFLGKN